MYWTRLCRNHQIIGKLLELAPEQILYAFRVEHRLRVGEASGRKMMLTSVDNKRFTSDQRCGVAKEEHGSVGGILDGAFASKRNPGFGRLSGAGSPEAAHPFGSGDGSGRNNIRSNAPRTLLDGDHPREGINASFCGRDMGLVWETWQRGVM